MELREPLDSLIAPPTRHTAATAFPRSQHLDGVKAYDNHLERLGPTLADLVADALVLGRG